MTQAAAILNIGVNQTYLVNQMRQALTQAESQFKGINLRINENAVRQPLGRITGDVNQFNKSLEAATARVVSFTATLGLIGGAIATFRNLVQSTIEVEKAFDEINSVFQLSEQGITKFSRGVFDAARSTAQSFEVASKAALEFSRQGLSAEDTLERIRSALQLTRLSGLEVSESIDAVTATLNGFSKEALTSSEIVNKLIAVDSRFAVSSQDLAKALERVGSTAQDSGVKFDQLLGLITSARQITGRGGDVIGNALKSIFTRLQRADTIDQLQSLNIAVRDLQGNVLPANELLGNLAKTYSDLTFEQQQYIAELSGGLFQINQLKALLSDLGRSFNISEEATRAASIAQDEAVKRNKVLNESLSSLIQNARTTGTELGSIFGNLTIANPLKAILGENTGGAFQTFRDTVINGFRKIGDDSAEFTNVGEEIAKSIGEGVARGLGNILTGPGAVIATVLGAKLVKLTAKNVIGSAQSVLGNNDNEKLDRGIQSTVNRSTRAELARLNAADTVEKKELAILAILERQAGLTQAIAGARIQQASAVSGNKQVSRLLTKIGGAAGGYLPNYVDEERDAIRRGVGGASAGAKPVVISDFNYGKGVKGTIVANTDEYIVPNYKGGDGSAILNKEMVENMGLPPGAQRIAAGGFVPNFAGVLPLRGAINLLKDYKNSGLVVGRGKQSLYDADFESVLIQKGAPFSTVLHEFGHYDDLGTFRNKNLMKAFKASPIEKERAANLNAIKMIQKYGGGEEGVKQYKNEIAPSTKTYKTVPLLKQLIKTGTLDLFDKAQAESQYPNSEKNSSFKQSAALIRQAMRRLGPEEFKRQASLLKSTLKTPIFAEGYIPNFAASLLKRSTLIGEGFMAQARRSKVRPDLAFKKFKEGNEMRPDKELSIENEYTISKLAEKRGLPVAKAYGSLERAKARGGIFKEYVDGFDLNAASALGIDTGAVNDYIQELFAEKGIRAVDAASKGNILIRGSRTAYSKQVELYGKKAATKFAMMNAVVVDPGEFVRTAAEGYSPLKDAIDREQRSVAKKDIYVDTDPRLKSPDNPSGMLVANRRDEPSGGFQGVDRVLREGGNPKKAGAATGYVPNFVRFTKNSGLITSLNPASGAGGVPLDPAQITKINSLFAALKKANDLPSLDKAADDILNFANTLEKASKKKVEAPLAGEYKAEVARIQNQTFRNKLFIGGVPQGNQPNPSGTPQTPPAAPSATSPLAPGNPNFIGPRQPYQAPVGTVSQLTQAQQQQAQVNQQRAAFIANRDNERRALAFQKLTERYSEGDQITPAQQQFVRGRIKSNAFAEAKQFLGPGSDPQAVRGLAKNIADKAIKDLDKAYSEARTIIDSGKRSLARPDGLFSALKNAVTETFVNPLKAFEKEVASGRFKGDVSTGRLIATNARQAQLARLSQFTTSAALIAPLVGGFIPEGKGGTAGGIASGAAGGAINGASTGLLAASAINPAFAPAGAAIGAVVGGITGAVGKLEMSFEELAQSIQKVESENARLISSTNNYVRLQAELEDAINSASAPVKPGEKDQRSEVINRIRRSQRQELNSIPEEQREKIIAAGFDYNKLKDALREINLSQAEQSQRAAATGAIFRLRDNPKLQSNFEETARALLAVADNLTVESVGSYLLQANEQNGRRLNSEGRTEIAREFLKEAGLDKQQVEQGAEKLGKLNQEQFTKFFDILLNTAKVNARTNESENVQSISRQANIQLDKRLLQVANTLESNSRTQDIFNSASQRIRGDIFGTSQRIGGSVFSENELLQQRSDFTTREAELSAGIATRKQTNLTTAGFAEELKDSSLTRSGEILKAQSVDQFQAIADKFKDTETGPKLQKMVDSLKDISAQGKLAIAEAKINNELQKIELKATQQNRALTQGNFDIDASARFSELSITSRQRRFDARGFAESANQTLEQTRTLDSLGLVRTPLVADRERELQTQSTLTMLSSLVGGISGNTPLATKSAVKSEAQSIIDSDQFDDDAKINAGRIKATVEALEFDVKGELDKLVNGGNANVQDILRAGGLSIDEAKTVGPLNSISGNTKEAALLLEDIRIILQNRELIRENENAQRDIETLRKKKGESIDGVTLFNKFDPNTSRTNAINILSRTIDARNTAVQNTKLASDIAKEANAKSESVVSTTEKTDAAVAKTQKKQKGTTTAENDIVVMDEYLATTSRNGEVQKRTTALDTFFQGVSSQKKRAERELESLLDIGKRFASTFESSLGNAFGDFVLGAASAKDAFRSFTISVLSDMSRAFAAKSAQNFSSAILSALPTGFGGTEKKAEGGRIGLNKGGMVPALLTGGEYYISPERARELGEPLLARINSASTPRQAFAKGGLVKGGSGLYDDVPANLPPGGYVIRKSAVEKYGAEYLDSLVQGRVQKRFLGGMLIGALVGGGVGYAKGGKKGALIGAAIGGIGGGLLQNYSQTGNIFQSRAGAGMFNFNSGASVGIGQAQSPLNNSLKYSMGTSPTQLIKNGLIQQGIAGGFGLAAQMLNGSASNREGTPWTNEQIEQNRVAMEREEMNMINSRSKPAILELNPQGGYSLTGFGAPSTRRFAGGGEVLDIPVSDAASGSSMAAMSSSDSMTQKSNGSAPNVSIEITINNEGGASSSSKTNNSKDDTNSEFANTMAKEMESTALRVIQKESRVGGLLYRK